MAKSKKLIDFRFWFNLSCSQIYRLKLGYCGARFRVRYPIVIEGGKNIEIGSSFFAMNYVCLYANDGGKLIIGDNCSINTNVQLGASSGKIMIGNNVLIGPNVVLRAADHGIGRHMLIKNQPHTYGEIFIEDDVWIGANAVITSNVVLHRGTVVGAGAVVTRSTDPYSIVAGTPARKIGERI